LPRATRGAESAPVTPYCRERARSRAAMRRGVRLPRKTSLATATDPAANAFVRAATSGLARSARNRTPRSLGSAKEENPDGRRSALQSEPAARPGGEWTRVGAEGIRADSESTHDAPEPTVADLGIGAGSGRGPMAAHVLPMLIGAGIAALRALGPRAAATLALREAARSRQFGDPSTSLGGVPPYSRTEVPRGTAADQAVLERFALFDALSARNNAEQVAVIEFKAGDYKRLGDLSVTYVGMISREKAEQLCPDLPTVQGALDAAVLSVESEGKLRRSLEPTKYGMEVHARTATTINAKGDENLRAEVYWRDGIEGESGLGSVKSDTQATPPNSKVFCIIDHKTGRKGLSPKRMLTLAAKASKLDRPQIIVMETRPSEGPPLEGP